MNENRTPVVYRLETARDPSSNRQPVRADDVGGLGDGVASMDFDAAVV
ncbi:MAG TPA: hypothetical protein VHT02_01880 [Methylocella sp.]|nr:hypothetical protein [Methylocella sp.]